MTSLLTPFAGNLMTTGMASCRTKKWNAPSPWP